MANQTTNILHITYSKTVPVSITFKPTIFPNHCRPHTQLVVWFNENWDPAEIVSMVTTWIFFYIHNF